MLPSLSPSSQLSLRSKMLLSSVRRKPCIQVALKYKFILGFAVFFLFAWMQLGTLRSGDSGNQSSKKTLSENQVPAREKNQKSTSDPTIPRIKAKEYPDFDYKYDLKKIKNPLAQEENEDQHLPKWGKKFRREDVSQMKLIIPPADDANQPPMHDFKPPDSFPNAKIPPSRRKKTLNGVALSDNHDQFNVVGGVDLYVAEHLSDGYDEFASDEALVEEGAGDGGAPVELTPEEAARGEEVMAKEAFNLVASNKMSLHRVVPDTRDPKCKRLTYDKELPTASVIIIFTNEAWTPLLRTIWSVLDKTPPEYLHEIILVDDFSDKKYLKGKLERYIQKKLPSKVRLKRLHQRSGLIRARLTGARLATGDVLVFLDSHCECGDDWLQPLLHRIKHQPNAFVVPIIDVIDDKTMEYYHGNGVYFQVGGFTWNGHFNWIDVPERESKRRGSPVGPTRTPTMAGGLFAVDRNYFWEIGSYDEEMDVWGGENLEMSFRVWQCGGVLETIPCSRVGHIFRSFHPYSFPGNKDTHGINTARTVEVWLDDYKRLFYMNRPDLITTDIGDVSNRLRFKEERGCHDFQWYLDNIFPEKFVLDDPSHAFAYGRVRNPTSNLCLDTLQNDEKDSYVLGAYPCHDYVAATQFFSLSRKYELRREDSCAEVSALAGPGLEEVRMTHCHGGEDQEWVHTKKGRIIHKETNKCLQAVRGAGAGADVSVLYAAPCKAIDSQVFFFDSYFS